MLVDCQHATIVRLALQLTTLHKMNVQFVLLGNLLTGKDSSHVKIVTMAHTPTFLQVMKLALHAHQVIIHRIPVTTVNVGFAPLANFKMSTRKLNVITVVAVTLPRA
jgi:hypothetical protein